MASSSSSSSSSAASSSTSRSALVLLDSSRLRQLLHQVPLPPPPSNNHNNHSHNHNHLNNPNNLAHPNPYLTLTVPAPTTTSRAELIFTATLLAECDRTHDTLTRRTQALAARLRHVDTVAAVHGFAGGVRSSSPSSSSSSPSSLSLALVKQLRSALLPLTQHAHFAQAAGLASRLRALDAGAAPAPEACLQLLQLATDAHQLHTAAMHAWQELKALAAQLDVRLGRGGGGGGGRAGGAVGRLEDALRAHLHGEAAHNSTRLAHLLTDLEVTFCRMLCGCSSCNGWLGGGYVQPLQPVPVCAACSSALVDPAVLPCGHRVCLNCCLAVKQSAGSVKCPVCHHDVHLCAPAAAVHIGLKLYLEQHGLCQCSEPGDPGLSPSLHTHRHVHQKEREDHLSMDLYINHDKDGHMNRDESFILAPCPSTLAGTAAQAAAECSHAQHDHLHMMPLSMFPDEDLSTFPLSFGNSPLRLPAGGEILCGPLAHESDGACHHLRHEHEHPAPPELQLPPPPVLRPKRKQREHAAEPDSKRPKVMFSCHFCKRKLGIDELLLCADGECQLKYCRQCLERHFKDDDERLGADWCCPRCRNCCTCARCRRKAAGSQYCHQCKARKEDTKRCRKCRKRYCPRCLEKHYDLDDVDGPCPACRGVCTCSYCKAKRDG